MSPVETLREAARLMRERAEAAGGADEDWRVEEDHQGYAAVVSEDSRSDVAEVFDDATAAHVASWHPAVALAVADWMESEQDVYERCFTATQAPSAGVDLPPGVHHGDPAAAEESAAWHVRQALAVARAYLGETA